MIYLIQCYSSLVHWLSSRIYTTYSQSMQMCRSYIQTESHGLVTYWLPCRSNISTWKSHPYRMLRKLHPHYNTTTTTHMHTHTHTHTQIKTQTHWPVTRFSSIQLHQSEVGGFATQHLATLVSELTAGTHTWVHCPVQVEGKTKWHSKMATRGERKVLWILREIDGRRIKLLHFRTILPHSSKSMYSRTQKLCHSV